MESKIQLAIDSDYNQLDLSRNLVDYIDILEIGTLAIFRCGVDLVKYARKLHPNKTIVADLKMADASSVLVPLFFDAGADMITLISAANINTIKNAVNEAKQRDKIIQIELYGNWNYEIAKTWYDAGVKKLVYHRLYEAKDKRWNEKDIQIIASLNKMGFEVSVAGGVEPSNIVDFKGCEIDIYIVGRYVLAAKDPIKAIDNLRTAIKDLRRTKCQNQ